MENKQMINFDLNGILKPLIPYDIPTKKESKLNETAKRRMDKYILVSVSPPIQSGSCGIKFAHYPSRFHKKERRTD